MVPIGERMQTLISAKDLLKESDNQDLIILDSRFYLTDLAKGKKEYDSGHIPGAIFIDLHHDLASPETEFSGRHPLPSNTDFSTFIQSLGIDSDSKVIVYDDMAGAIAARAWWMLSQNGIETRVLDGGIQAWLSVGGELESNAAFPQATVNKIDVHFPWAVSEEEVLENMEAEIFQLVDARASDRYEGQNETMDPLAGHIPGAINRPFANNLNKDGLFLASKELSSEFQSLKENVELVHYCGSGVTACHNVLASAEAGLEDKRVFVGSWSFWSKRMLRLMSEQAE